MASNFFGQIFRITTFGESHGPAVGVVIDGCPAGIEISPQEIDRELALRRPGFSSLTSPRKEEDVCEMISGVFEGKTTGAPIAILIKNNDAKSASYLPLKDIYRPGHANFTYLKKYGIFDYRGGGRSSARETAARVAAGAVAKKMLQKFGIECLSFVSEIGCIAMGDIDLSNISDLKQKTYNSLVFCPDREAEERMKARIEQVKGENDSVGGILVGIARISTGLGDPVYCKLESMLASAMMSIPASKGFEMGLGFESARKLGSEHNDLFDIDENHHVFTTTNSAGGTLGGISTGSDLYFRVAFKPTSSIKKAQATVTVQGQKTTLQLSDTARHDPCIAIRAVPVVEAMTALVLADAVLMNLTAKV